MLAVARTLGVTPAQAAAALGFAQLVPAAVGLALGGAVGVMLFNALSSSSQPTPAPTAQLLGLAVLTLVLTLALSAVPARLEARRPIAETLHAG